MWREFFACQGNLQIDTGNKERAENVEEEGEQPANNRK